jgi:hypothetical protein
LDTTNAALAGVWTIDASGEVTDASGKPVEEMTYNTERGVLTRTYMYEDIVLTVDMPINVSTPMSKLCVTNFEAWCLTKGGTLERKTYGTVLSRYGRYGYAGDGKGGELLLSIAEAQAILADKSKVDMSTREFDQQTLMGAHRNSRGEFKYGDIRGEILHHFGWATNKVPVFDVGLLTS